MLLCTTDWSVMKHSFILIAKDLEKAGFKSVAADSSARFRPVSTQSLRKPGPGEFCGIAIDGAGNTPPTVTRLLGICGLTPGSGPARRFLVRPGEAGQRA